MQTLLLPVSSPVTDESIPNTRVARKLAELLQPYRTRQTLLLALPDGTMQLAEELARLLRLPLDVMVSREFYLPREPLVPAGALSEGGGLYFNAAALRLPNVAPLALWDAASQARHEVTQLVEQYRHGHPLAPVNRRNVVLIVPMLGSGLAALAAIQALHYGGVRRCIVATAYCTPVTAELVAARADTLVALSISAPAKAAVDNGSSPASALRQKIYA